MTNGILLVFLNITKSQVAGKRRGKEMFLPSSYVEEHITELLSMDIDNHPLECFPLAKFSGSDVSMSCCCVTEPPPLSFLHCQVLESCGPPP